MRSMQQQLGALGTISAFASKEEQLHVYEHRVAKTMQTLSHKATK